MRWWPRLWTSPVRKELERLRESEARYRLMAEHAHDVLLQYDAAGVVQYVSPSVARLGLRPDDLIGKTLAQLTHPDDPALALAEEKAGPDGPPLPGEDSLLLRLRCGDGSWRWLQGNPAAMLGDDGRMLGSVSIMRDVTDQRRLEDQLRESEASYRQLAESAGDIIARVDLKGIIEFISPSVAALGYRPEQMIGRSTNDFVHPDEQTGAVLAAIRAGRPPPSGRDNEFRLRRADGGWVWMEGRPAAICDAVGEPVAMVTVLRDITEQRRLEDELRRKEAEAQGAAIAKSEFLATMSHEIRTPLTAVVGFAGLLGKMQGLPDKALTYVDRIARSGEALTSIVNNVLDFSKIEAGQVELRPEPLELRAFVDDVLGVLQDSAEAKGLRLSGEVVGPHPSAVLADAQRLRQVVLNLLTNAIKFTHQGEVSLEVRWRQGALLVSVRDTGIGIAPEAATRLFQRFSQVDSSNARRFGGAGLGLAISRGLVELMGGEIAVESVEGRGSQFWFRVPAKSAGASRRAAEPEAAKPPAGARVLVVDDARANRELIMALLGPFDLQLTEAVDGLEALEAARQTTFDLVLMDLQMPGLDGIAATRAIRGGSDLNRDTPILAVSASVQPADVDACRQAGMDDHIAKPINARELVGKVAHWIGAPRGPGSQRATG